MFLILKTHFKVSHTTSKMPIKNEIMDKFIFYKLGHKCEPILVSYLTSVYYNHIKAQATRHDCLPCLLCDRDIVYGAEKIFGTGRI